MLASHSIPKRAGFVSCLHLAELSVSPDGVIERLGAVALVFACLLGGLVPDQLHAQTPNLSFLNNYFVTGDHIVRDFQASSGPSTNGFVNGTITIPTSSAGSPIGIPDGADIVAAFLYWQTLETSSTPSGGGALFNGYSITGDAVGYDLQSACGTTLTVRSYRANVLPYLPIVNGVSQAATTHNVGLPAGLNGPSGGPAGGLPGASLVVVYRVLGPNYLKATVIYDGNSAVLNPGPPSYRPLYFDLAIRGFYDAVVSNDNLAEITDILSTVRVDNGGNVSLLPVAGEGSLTSYPILSDSASEITSRVYPYYIFGQCHVWTAVVFSTMVKSADGDGILDAWKNGPASPDINVGKPGYYDVRPPYSWVDLSGAQLGFQNGSTVAHKDIFVQYDWMVGADGHSHRPPQAALDMVTQAFANQNVPTQNVSLHFVPGNAIHEDTCTDDLVSNPPNLCLFPGEPGVVVWKTGLEVLKAWPIDPTSCISSGNCTPRFPIAQKDSYRYMLFGHSLALPTWSIQAGTLVSITVTNQIPTVTMSAPIQSCPSRVAIDGALAVLGLNGVYIVTSCTSPTTMFTLSPVNSNANVGNGTYSNTSTPPEPQLAIYIGQTDTTSGYSDVGGGDIAVTLGKWYSPTCWLDPTQCQSPAQFLNVHTGTLMHELGHTLGLTHGGRYFPTGLGSAPAFDPNCKPNYQSVMSYLFQVDLLQDALGKLVPDYSGQVLNFLNEDPITGNLNTSQGLQEAAYPYTKWYSPYPVLSGSKPTASHCDGTPIGPNEPAMYAIAGPASPIAWANGWDINFDGSYTALNGYNDWMEIDPRQVGASGNDNVSGLLYQDQVNNELQFVGGGNYTFLPGGGIRAAGGGGIRAAGGGGIRAAGGGGIRAAGGGGIRAAGGGGIRAAGGGGVGEADYPTIDSYVRPPRAVTTQNATVFWKPATFGNIQQYNVYRSVNGVTVLIGSVANNPSTTIYSFTDQNPILGATYYATTIDLDFAGNQRESTPGSTKAYQLPLTLSGATPLTYNSSETLTSTGGSTNGTVTYNLVSGPCTLSGAVLTANSGTGSCSVTATMVGDSSYNPVTSAVLTITLQTNWTASGFYPPISMPTSNTPVWNVVKGGSTVPLKFNIYAGSVQQTSIGAVKGGTVSIRSVGCNSVGSVSYTTDSLQDTGATALRYDTTAGQFIQNWKTPKSAGACYVAVMTAADNVTTLQAYFKTN